MSTRKFVVPVLVEVEEADYELNYGRIDDLETYTAETIRDAAIERFKLVGWGKLADPVESEPVEAVQQQPGTHRELVRLQWTETVSYDEEVEIDVPDGYEGELVDLIEVDNDPFSDGEIEGVPEGYQSNWLDRAMFDGVVDTTDREINDVYAVDSAVAAANTLSSAALVEAAGEARALNED